jgi:hypothetical protein
MGISTSRARRIRGLVSCAGAHIDRPPRPVDHHPCETGRWNALRLELRPRDFAAGRGWLKRDASTEGFGYSHAGAIVTPATGRLPSRFRKAATSSGWRMTSSKFNRAALNPSSSSESARPDCQMYSPDAGGFTRRRTSEI